MNHSGDPISPGVGTEGTPAASVLQTDCLPRAGLCCIGDQLPVFQEAGLLSLITDPVHTPITLFWPTDQALQALPPEQQDFLFNQGNKDKLEEYLKFHVIRDSKVFCFHTEARTGLPRGDQLQEASVRLHLHGGPSIPAL